MAALRRLMPGTQVSDTSAGARQLGAAKETPALRQYLASKREHPDCMVLFRLGDFFEIFGDDAVQASHLLGLTLTGRDFGRGGRVPMCGMPHHSVQAYAARLLAAGRRVAICDQVEAPAKGGKLVARRVVRVLTPGTLVEDSLLDPKLPRRCAGIMATAEGTGLAVVDFSSAECFLSFREGHLGTAVLLDELRSWDVAEVVLAATDVSTPEPPGLACTRLPLAAFSVDAGRSLLNLAGAAAPRQGPAVLLDAALQAMAGVAAHGYAGSLSLESSGLRVAWSMPGQVMGLDHSTVRNLELLEPASQEGRSLLSLIDRTTTAPGGRLLRSWLQSPLVDLERLHARQVAVSEMLEQQQCRGAVRARLRGCRDLERLTSRCTHGLAGPRDLQQLAQTISQLPEVSRLLDSVTASRVRALQPELLMAPIGVAERIAAALVDEAPVLALDGGFIRSGYDPELDQIVEGGAAAREYISQLEARERERTGIKGLKVGYNRVFGYYLEVRGSRAGELPSEYMRRQTLVGAERYVTAEMKDQEAIVLTARERSLAREQVLLRELLELTALAAHELGRCSAAMAELDCLLTLAEVGSDLGWVMPEIDSSRSLDLRQSRHPLVEDALGPGRFVPNDLSMDGETERIWLITGPNMAGKSTFLRQVALICLLGQVGSAVPCQSARWGLVDRIFTRVGAQDDLAGGRSTFMVEMSEVAEILERATPRSLLVLDEVGRGTSTYDGMSLAQAILEHLHDDARVAARTLFSTHYHELTELARLPALRNYRAEVFEDPEGGDVTFLHTIVPGGADRSYGIHVARLAGIPEEVVARARAILVGLEASRPLSQEAPAGEQMALPLTTFHPLVEELRAIKVDSMTPLEALRKLAEWQAHA
ncbi:MAG: DNA mismatch repair protein MutS [Candidatus Dormibacteria bacterium]